MAVSSQFKTFICDLFSGLGLINARSMFGGAGLYCEGVMFALIADDTLYIKVDEALKIDLAKLDCGPFMVDFGKDDQGPRPMNGYWSMPQSALDDPDEACQWGQRALDYAQSVHRPKNAVSDNTN